MVVSIRRFAATQPPNYDDIQKGEERMKNKLFVLLVVLMLVLSACGGGTTPEAPAATEPASATEPAVVEEPASTAGE